MTWVAAADFRRAKNDGKPSHPCLVYGKVEHLDDTIMAGAVASGAVRARLSHVGARLAVRGALDHLRAHRGPAGRSATDATGEQARALYRDMLETVRSELRRAVVDHVAPLQDFATALSVFVATPAGAAAMQIGGGLIVTRGRGGDYSLLFSDAAARHDVDDGSITDADPAAQMRVRVESGPLAFLCAASAPLDRLSVRQRDGLPQKDFFAPLDRYASTAPDDGEVHRSIRTFLRSERIHGRLNRDVVLALCGYRRQGEPLRASAA